MEQLTERHSVCKIFSPETSKAVYRIFDAGIAKEFNLKALFEGTYTQCEHFMQNGLPVPCGCKLCSNDAASQVSFFLSPNRKAIPATTAPVLFVCDEHSNVHFVDICSNYTWNTICDNFRKRNLAMPQKEFFRACDRTNKSKAVFTYQAESWHLPVCGSGAERTERNLLLC